MKDIRIKKSVAVSVILLFIGVAIAPSINFNVVKASNDNDLVEVTTQACGINGFGNTTVKLTREQYQNLERNLATFKERLNQTTSREEVKKLYNEFIVELDNYGLLGRLSIKQAQRLMTGIYTNAKLTSLSETILNKVKGLTPNESNYLCFVYGEPKEHTYFQGPIGRISGLFFSLFVQGLIFVHVLVLILVTLIVSSSFFFSSVINPLQIGTTIYYGLTSYDFSNGWREWSATGLLRTTGLLGNKSWNGTFYGYLPIPTGFFGTTYLPGINGFIGLRIRSNSLNYYFGSALWVQMTTEPPFITR